MRMTMREIRESIENGSSYNIGGFSLHKITYWLTLRKGTTSSVCVGLQLQVNGLREGGLRATVG